ncbi:Flp pilus assembly protein CpaB [Kineosporia babensis]|uniref:SAF domain-containing protein n=1 Tax=Kineosporia babensis TaxID=499548 RepID=A0A9X1ST76_9ACTN|nr:SAF domain-containing protein [Kineosporia babensis]MCD5311529.1 SAF domain-containing protein [Kineosporia babensis]
MGRRTLALIGSVLLAAAGTAIVALYVRGADSRATQGQALGTFVVATREIAAGETITAEDVHTRPMRADDQPGTTATGLDTVIGRRAVAGILAGATVDERVLSRPGADVDLPAAVRAGELGVNVQLADPNRAVSLLGVGSQVRVFTLKKEKVQQIVRQARVISIGATLEDSGAPGPDGQHRVGSPAVPQAVVGLSVPQEQAEVLMRVQMQQQPMYFALIPSGDVTAGR